MPRATTAKMIIKPYDKPERKPKVEVKPKIEVKPKVEPKATTSPKPQKTGGYDRKLLVGEVAKTTNPNWEQLGVKVNKTATQCKDTWRKTLRNAILSGGHWCIMGPGWTKEMKQTMVNEVFDNAKPDWDKISALFKGKTANQVKDVWRKVVLPKLKNGEALGQ